MKKKLRVGCLVVFLLSVAVYVIAFIVSSPVSVDGEKLETGNGSSIDEYYSKSVRFLIEDDFIKANQELLKIVAMDSTYSKIDSLRLAIGNQHQNALKDLNKDLESLKRKMDFNEDEFNQITWVSPKSSKGTYGNRVYVYFGIKNDNLQSPRLKIRYYGDDWLFWEKATFLIDGTPYNYIPTSRPSRDNNSDVWETSDQIISENMLNILKSMFEAKEVKYRLSGKYYKDFTLSKARINEIKDVLQYHYLLDNSKLITDFKLN